MVRRAIVFGGKDRLDEHKTEWEGRADNERMTWNPEDEQIKRLFPWYQVGPLSGPTIYRNDRLNRNQDYQRYSDQTWKDYTMSHELMMKIQAELSQQTQGWRG